MCSHAHSGLLAAGGGSGRPAGFTPRRLVRCGWMWGGVWGISIRGRPAGENRCPSRQERDRGCRVPFSSLRDPVLAGSRLSEPEAVVGKPLARQPSGPASSSQARPSARPAIGGNYGGGSRPQAGGKAHGECLGVSPNAAGRGKRGGSELHRQGELPRIPNLGEAFRCRGSQGGILGTFLGIHSQREGHPLGAHWLL